MQEKMRTSAYKSLSKTSLYAGRPRLDVACMLMERREWAIGRWFMTGKRSTHPTLDSSPNSGRDIFGCVLDLFTTNENYEQIILPFTTLGHGFTSVADKAIAFLWSMFLVCGGSDLRVMESVLTDMRSLCSDFGVEAGIASLPNFFDQWASALGLRVSDEFKQHPRLFPLMVLVPDFNHLTSNITRRLFTSIARLPELIAHIRALCKFFRNAEYRSTLRQAMVNKGRADVAASLGSWSSSVARWRYETIFEVLRDLVKVRCFCQTFYDRSLIGRAGHVEHQ